MWISAFIKFWCISVCLLPNRTENLKYQRHEIELRSETSVGDNKTAHFVLAQHSTICFWRDSPPCGNLIWYLACVFFVLFCFDPRGRDTGIQSMVEMPSHCWDVLIQPGGFHASSVRWTTSADIKHLQQFSVQWLLLKWREEGRKKVGKKQKKEGQKEFCLSSKAHVVLKDSQWELKGSSPSSNLVCHHLMNEVFVLSLSWDDHSCQVFWHAPEPAVQTIFTY